MKRALSCLMVCFVAVVTLSVADAGPVRNFLAGRHVAAPPAFDNACPGGVCTPQSAPASPTVQPAQLVGGKVTANLRSDLFSEFVRLKVAAELRKKGATFADAHAQANSLSNDMIRGCADAVHVPVTAFGDGSIIQAIIAFFQSPQGQALLQALIQMLLGLLAGG